MYRAVIFDLDGTILNTLDDLADSANRVLAARGLPTHATERYKTFVGNGIPRLIERMVPPGTPPQTVAALLDEFMADYDRHKNDKTAPYPGIPELLRELRRRGVRLCVLSNKQNDMSAAVVRHHFGEGVFDRVLGQRRDFPPKPDPASCRFLMESLGTGTADTLYVGDSNVDMQTAHRAGLTACGVSWGFRSVEELTAEGAACIVRTPMEILTLVTAGDSSCIG